LPNYFILVPFQKLSVENAVFHLFTDSIGYSNKYLLSKKDTSTAKQKAVP